MSCLKNVVFVFSENPTQIERHVPFLPAWSKTSAKTSIFFFRTPVTIQSTKITECWGQIFCTQNVKMFKIFSKADSERWMRWKPATFGNFRMALFMSQRTPFILLCGGFTSILHMSHLICEDMSSERSELYEWFPKIKAASGYSTTVHPVLETFINII